jgi:hypothetical protein
MGDPEDDDEEEEEKKKPQEEDDEDDEGNEGEEKEVPWQVARNVVTSDETPAARGSGRQKPCREGIDSKNDTETQHAKKRAKCC